MVDVKLADNHVEIEGALVVNGPDIHLSTDERRDSRNASTYRRALVHDFNDSLVINFNNDFKGVKINGSKSEGIDCRGNVHVDGKLTCSSSIHSTRLTCEDIIETSRLIATKNLEVSDEGRMYVGGKATFKVAPQGCNWGQTRINHPTPSSSSTACL